MKVADLVSRLQRRDPRAIARAISLVEDNDPAAAELLDSLDRGRIDEALIIGITGPPGAGKSTLTGRLVGVLRRENRRVGVLAVDPSSVLSGGAVLGDRIRMMDHAADPDVVIRSMASRGRLGGLCAAAGAVARIMAAAGCTPVVIETVGVGQLEMDVARLADLTVLVLAPGLGDEIQAMKAGVLEVADLLVVNKADLPGADNLITDLRAALTPDIPLLVTSAATGTGVRELAGELVRIDERERQGGRQSRRRQARIEEIVDWAMDLLRPRLRRKAGEMRLDHDPKIVAQRLVAELVRDDHE
ncbi:MAG: methylmalonyl Co-A mutase-associated GTPase MeaB [Thermodesulfobacteriota bacterium]